MIPQLGNFDLRNQPTPQLRKNSDLSTKALNPESLTPCNGKKFELGN